MSKVIICLNLPIRIPERLQRPDAVAELPGTIRCARLSFYLKAMCAPAVSVVTGPFSRRGQKAQTDPKKFFAAGGAA